MLLWGFAERSAGFYEGQIHTGQADTSVPHKQVCFYGVDRFPAAQALPLAAAGPLAWRIGMEGVSPW